MIDKIDLRPIIRAHFRTFRNFESQKVSPGDYLLFVVLPAALTAVLVAVGVRLRPQSVGILVAALAVFAGLFFNLVILVADLAVRGEDQPPTRERRLRIKSRVLVEVHANVSFAILVSVLCLACLAALGFEGPLAGRIVLESFALFLIIQFFLTLLMILKRMHALIGAEVQGVQRKAS
jgi:hypothetical protein